MKLTVKQYAENMSISVQSIYAQIKRGDLNWVEENGIKYVVVDDNSIKPKVENNLNLAFKIIKRKDKEIKRLTKQLAKCNKKSEGVYLSYIAELKHLQLKAPVKQSEDDTDIIEVKTKKKKSKKKSKKKN